MQHRFGRLPDLKVVSNDERGIFCSILYLSALTCYENETTFTFTAAFST